LTTWSVYVLICAAEGTGIRISAKQVFQRQERDQTATGPGQGIRIGCGSNRGQRQRDSGEQVKRTARIAANLRLYWRQLNGSIRATATLRVSLRGAGSDAPSIQGADRSFLALVCLSALALGVLLAGAAAPAAAGPCPNEAIREQQHATALLGLPGL
jgi:hypothetical protein